jgi:hypothetical protein
MPMKVRAPGQTAYVMKHAPEHILSDKVAGVST